MHFINSKKKLDRKTDNILAESYCRYVSLTVKTKKCNAKFNENSAHKIPSYYFSWNERGGILNTSVKYGKQLKPQTIRSYDHAFDRKVMVTPC